MKLNTTRRDVLGLRHSTLGMLGGAAGLLAGAALLVGVPHSGAVSVAGSLLLALFGVDTVYATWKGPRPHPPQPAATSVAVQQTLGVDRWRMAGYALIGAAFAAAAAFLAADTAGATRVANVAVLISALAGALFCAGYVLLGDRAAVRLAENGVADSTRPWRRTFVSWEDLAAVSLQPLPGTTSAAVFLHVRRPDGGGALVPVQAHLRRGGAQAVVEAITQHSCYRGGERIHGGA